MGLTYMCFNSVHPVTLKLWLHKTLQGVLKMQTKKASLKYTALRQFEREERIGSITTKQMCFLNFFVVSLCV